MSLGVSIQFTEGIYCIELGALAHYALSQLLNLHLLFSNDSKQVLNSCVRAITSISAVRLG